MGKSVQIISDRVSLIASEQTWIEGLAIEQLTKTAQLAGMQQVAGMPDLHPGRGYPIGAAFYSVGQLYPALVGNDIGCGMGLWQTSLKASKLNFDKLSKRLQDVEAPLGESWQDLLAERKRDKSISTHGFDTAFGTIGRGNHFAEFQAIDCVYDSAQAKALALDAKQAFLLVHSGSRGLGQAILSRHIEQHNHAGLRAGSEACARYLAQHDEALRWAELNREMIARRFMAAARSDGDCVLDVNHNLLESVNVAGREGWLHRKGATPADKGYVVIPGSRGDYSYLVKPEPSPLSLFSLAHGAGRKWKRGDCQSRLSHKYKRDDLYRTRFGSRVICGDKTLLYDEAPHAYKPCESIISNLQQAGLITLVARLKPLLTFKTQGGC